MAGIENNITFSQGHKLQPSTAQDILNMQRDSDDISLINYTGDPEGAVSANPGSLCHDPVAGILYLKSTGTSNTGWAQVGTSAALTITADSGGPQGTLADNWTITGGVNFDISGAASVFTFDVTGPPSATTLTNHGVVLGQGASAMTATATGSAGQIFQSGGASADPAYSTATYPSVATSTGSLLRADGTNWSVTTSTYPNTNAINTLLYASAANVMSALATANNGVLITSNTGVPSILAGPGTTGNILQSNAAAAPSFSTATYPSVATGTGTLLRADGTNWTATTSTYPDTNAINTLLYASAANVMSALATANNGTLITSATGVPSWLANGTTGQVFTATTGSPPSWQNASSGSISFIDQGSSTTVASNTGYFVTGNFAMTLPASPSQGDLVIIVADTTSAVTVTGNTGQIIRIGNQATAAAGSVVSSARGDSLTLRYRASGTTWIAVSSMGDWV